MDAPAPPDAPRRCRRRRPIDPNAPRPSEMLAAFFLAGIAFLAAGAVAAIADAFAAATWLHWLTLHLLFLGGVSQLILGAGQFFTCAFLATSPPSKRFVRAELAVWNTGVVLVAVGVPADLPPMVDAGGVLVAGGLVLFGIALAAMQRRSLQQARWAVRWYQACAVALGVGALVGIAMARGTAWSHGSLLGAHIALNVAGWMGTAIVGTLHTFVPSLTGTRLQLPRLQAPTFSAWVLGVGALAVGAAFDVEALMIIGWLALATAATLLSLNVLASLRHKSTDLGLAARLIALGQVALVAGVVVALAVTIGQGADAALEGTARSALAVLLLAGWVGQTVAGALLHLLAVLARVRNFALAMPEPRPARDRAVAVAAAVAVTALALGQLSALDGLKLPAQALAVLVAASVAAQIAVLVRRAVAPRRGGGGLPPHLAAHRRPA